MIHNNKQGYNNNINYNNNNNNNNSDNNNVNINYCFPKDFLARPMNTKAVWLTKICLPKLPVVTHKNCAGQYNIITHPYRCYWVTDWSKITPIFFVLIQYPWELNFWCGTSSPPLKLSPGKARPTVAVTVVSWSLSLDKFKTNSILLAGRFWGGAFFFLFLFGPAPFRPLWPRPVSPPLALFDPVWPLLALLGQFLILIPRYRVSHETLYAFYFSIS